MKFYNYDPDEKSVKQSSINFSKFIQDLGNGKLVSYKGVSDILYSRIGYISAEKSLEITRARDTYTTTYGWVLLTREFVDDCITFLKDKKVLEVGCGSGYLAHFLKQDGVDIIATDDNTWAEGREGTEDRFKFYRDCPFIDIEKLDAVKAIEKYAKDVDIVLMSWPPYDEPMAEKVAKACYEYGLDLLYIGEDWSGCNGTDEFFDVLEEKFTQDIDVTTFLKQHFLSFSYIHDRPMLYRANKKES